MTFSRNFLFFFDEIPSVTLRNVPDSEIQGLPDEAAGKMQSAEEGGYAARSVSSVISGGTPSRTGIV